jgi:CRISPR system Cascade subunit CasD
VFLVAVEGDDTLLEALQAALRRPHFPLYLGRRSCPPVGQVELGLRLYDAVESLHAEPWHASPWFQRSLRQPEARLDLVADCAPGTAGAELVRDEPVEHGFDPLHRQWEWRTVLRHEPVHVPNPFYAEVPARVADPHDPLAVL